MKKMPLMFNPAPHQQRGVVLLISLIMLVAMTLVGVSMLRSVGFGAGIAGNLAFKQNATSVADLGTEIARNWVLLKGTSSPNDLLAASAADGYYANWVDGFNPLTHDWANSKKLKNADAGFISATTAKDDTGNEIRYVLHRLCKLDGAVSPADNPGQICANYTDYSALSSKGGTGYGQKTPLLAEEPYERGTAGVKGRRNSEIDA